MHRAVARALEHWVERGLLDVEQARLLRQSLEEHSEGRTARIFATIGAVIAGIGVLLFVASNWQWLGIAGRVLTLLTGYGVVVGAALWAERRGLPRIAIALWLLATLVVGAGIFLIAQIFNHSLTYWQGPALWMLAALVMGWALRSRAQVALAVPLGLLALGWFGGGAGWFMDDQMQFLVDERGLRPLLPTLGLGLVAAGLVVSARTEARFAQVPLEGWGMALLAVPLVPTTASRELLQIFEIDWTGKQLFVIAFVVAMGVAAAGVVIRRPGRSVSALGMAVALVFLLSLLVPVNAGENSATWAGINGFTYVVYVLAVFGLALVAIGVGSRVERVAWINLGIGCIAVLVAIQYWSWSWLLFDRALVFLVGGIGLIGVAALLERRRRALIAGLEGER